MKVVFLDIDGVLNNNHTKERCNGFLGVDRELSTKFLKWIEGKDVKIILSSTWRLHQDMWEHLHDAGIHWIGITPNMPRVARGYEIAEYLDKHPEITHHVILDDMDEMLPGQNHVLIVDGITNHNLEMAAELLHV